MLQKIAMGSLRISPYSAARLSGVIPEGKKVFQQSLRNPGNTMCNVLRGYENLRPGGNHLKINL